MIKFFHKLKHGVLVRPQRHPFDINFCSLAVRYNTSRLAEELKRLGLITRYTEGYAGLDTYLKLPSPKDFDERYLDDTVRRYYGKRKIHLFQKAKADDIIDKFFGVRIVYDGYYYLITDEHLLKERLIMIKASISGLYTTMTAHTICIDDSYVVENKVSMNRVLAELKHKISFDNFNSTLFKKRSVDSLINQWICQNNLYKFGIGQSRFKNIVFQDEISSFRENIYWLLSRFTL